MLLARYRRVDRVIFEPAQLVIVYHDGDFLRQNITKGCNHYQCEEKVMYRTIWFLYFKPLLTDICSTAVVAILAFYLASVSQPFHSILQIKA